MSITRHRHTLHSLLSKPLRSKSFNNGRQVWIPSVGLLILHKAWMVRSGRQMMDIALKLFILEIYERMRNAPSRIACLTKSEKHIHFNLFPRERGNKARLCRHIYLSPFPRHGLARAMTPRRKFYFLFRRVTLKPSYAISTTFMKTF